MNNLLLKATVNPLALGPMGTTEAIVIAIVAGGVVLAGIAALLIKSIGQKAIDKVDPADVPRVLGALGAWIAPFARFRPEVPTTMPEAERGPESADPGPEGETKDGR